MLPVGNRVVPCQYPVSDFGQDLIVHEHLGSTPQNNSVFWGFFLVANTTTVVNLANNLYSI